MSVPISAARPSSSVVTSYSRPERDASWSDPERRSGPSRNRAATNASPPLFPRPAATTTTRAPGSATSRTARATACPLDSISCFRDTPSAAAFASTAAIRSPVIIREGFDRPTVEDCGQRTALRSTSRSSSATRVRIELSSEPRSNRDAAQATVESTTRRFRYQHCYYQFVRIVRRSMAAIRVNGLRKSLRIGRGGFRDGVHRRTGSYTAFSGRTVPARRRRSGR